MKPVNTIARNRAERAKKQVQRRKKQLLKIPPSELLKLLPQAELDALAQGVGVDVQVKHLFAPLLVRLFILAILQDKDQSLQSLADLYNTRRFEQFSGKGAHQTRKNSLSDRFSTMKSEYFENLYDSYLSALEKKFGKKLGQKHGWLVRFDSTMVALCASLTSIGMRVGALPKNGKGKVQIKITIGLKGILPSTVVVSHQQSMLSEETALKAAIESQEAEKDAVITFDMGLKKRKSFKTFSEDGRFFVTRLKDPRYQVVRTHKEIKGRKHGKLKFLSDQIVHLYESGSTSNLLEHDFRLIVAQCEFGEHAGKTLYFLTNIMDMTAFEIADIYQRRWDIEVFFKFMKQHIGLTKLLSTNENGIKCVIYLRMLVGSMVWVFSHLNNRTDFSSLKRKFEDEVDWQVTLIASSIVAESDLNTAKSYLLDYQKGRTKKIT